MMFTGAKVMSTAWVPVRAGNEFKQIILFKYKKIRFSCPSDLDNCKCHVFIEDKALKVIRTVTLQIQVDDGT